MKTNRFIRIISLTMCLAMVMALIPSSVGLADQISGSSVTAYDGPSGSATGNKVYVSGNYPLSNGGYWVPNLVVDADGNHANAGGSVFVKASDVSVKSTVNMGPGTTPTQPVPTQPGQAVVSTAPTQPGQTTVTPTNTTTLAPGVTVSPTAPPITGEIDTNYKGTIVKFTARTEGLALYSDINFKNQAETVKSGTTITLTLDATLFNASGDTYYSTYYNNKTYYVPKNLITSAAAGATLPPNQTNSAELVDVATATANTAARITELKALIATLAAGNAYRARLEAELAELQAYNAASGIPYYTKYTAGIGTIPATVDPTTRVGYLSNASIQRMNLSFVVNGIYSFTDGSNKYYISASYIDGNSRSSAQVVGNSDAGLVSTIAVLDSTTYPVEDGGLRLYLTPTNTANYIVISSDKNGITSLYGSRDDSGWYRVNYNNKAYYVDPNHQSFLVSGQSAYNATVSTSTFYVTIGANGATLYSSYSSNALTTNLTPSGPPLDPGMTVLVSSINGYWYSYSNGRTYSYFLKSAASSSMVSASQLSSYRVKLYLTTPLYERMESSITASTASLPSTGKLNDGGGDYAYFTVKSVDESWFSIDISDKTYYIKKSSLTSGATIEQIATTAAGKTYKVIIGVDNAKTYIDSGCTTEGPITYRKGASVSAKKVNSVLYMVTVQASANSAGVNYYLPASYVAFVDGTDDLSGTNSTDPNAGAKQDIYNGEKDEAFASTVMSYTVPATGLWLYYDETCSKPAVALSSGRTVQLVAAKTPGAYTTWYGGSQYYVSLSSMSISDKALDNTTTYSVKIGNKSVVLYKKAVVPNAVTDPNRRVVLSEKTSVELGADTRANVKVHMYRWVPAASGKAGYYDKTRVDTYSTVYQGTTYYFYAEESGASNVDTGSFMTATAADNSNTSLIRKLTVSGSVWAYANPSLNGNYTGSESHIVLSAGTTVYGTLYNKYCYQVVYNGEVWYLDINNVSNGDLGEEFLSITDGANSSTFSVVIGINGAKTYITMRAADKTLATDKTNTNRGRDLSAGEQVLATMVNSGWYSFYDAGSSRTLYFQASANSGVGNSTSAAAVSSFILELASNVNLYTDISTNAAVLSTSLSSGSKYTFRTINDTWSSVFYNGNTYYVKNTDLYASKQTNGITPVASTTVGKTYTITVGRSVYVYPSVGLDKAGGDRRGPLAAGTTLSGTKMYDAASNQLVYQITFNGVTGYIDADAVLGVQSGDEADEAKKAAEEAEKNKTVYVALSSGTTLYTSTDTNSTTATLPSGSTYKLTRVNDSWYSMDFLGKTYYIPASVVNASTGGIGSSTAVGESIMHTLSFSINTYSAPTADASVVGQLVANQLVKLTKVSDSWFELDQATKKVYVKATDIDGATGTGTSAGQTTDGTGIITPTIKITGTSGTVNLRKAAKLGSTVMHRIPIDTIVPNNGYEKDSSGQLWYKTSYGGISGYVIGTYVSAVGTVGGGTSTSGSDPSLDIGRTLTVAVSQVNVRSGAGPTFGIVGKLDKGTAVVPTSYKEGTDGMVWYAFKYSANTTAYVRYDYLSGSIASTAELSGNVAIKAGDTNLRKGAGGGFGVVAKLSRDTIVTIVGSGTDNNNALWYRVTINNLSGYVRADLVRQLTNAEVNSLSNAIVGSYSELKSGSTGPEVLALQKQLISIGYLAAGLADGTYGSKTIEAVTKFQKAKGLSATGVATPATQVAIYNTSAVSSGTTASLDWFATGVELLKKYPDFQVYDISTGTTWNAKYINGANHADVVPASAGDAQKLKANSITGSYVRRPVICTINGMKYAGSMYAVGHGSTSYVSYFSGVMCIHFTGSKTHGTGNVDADHQSAIQQAINSGF